MKVGSGEIQTVSVQNLVPDQMGSPSLTTGHVALVLNRARQGERPDDRQRGVGGDQREGKMGKRRRWRADDVDRARLVVVVVGLVGIVGVDVDRERVLEYRVVRVGPRGDVKN